MLYSRKWQHYKMRWAESLPHLISLYLINIKHLARQLWFDKKKTQVSVQTYHKLESRYFGNCCHCQKNDWSHGQSVRCFQWIDGCCEPVSSKVTLIVCLSPEPEEQDQLRWCRSRWPGGFSTASTRAVSSSDVHYMASWFAVASQIALVPSLSQHVHLLAASPQSSHQDTFRLCNAQH